MSVPVLGRLFIVWPTREALFDDAPSVVSKGLHTDRSQPASCPANRVPSALPPLSAAEQPHPTLRANPFPEVTDLICRLPLPTLFYVARGYSPWRPDAVMSTTKQENNSWFLCFPLDFQGPMVAHRTARKKYAALPAF